MKLLLIPFLLCSVASVNGQSIAGKWKTIDDETGEERSVVEIFERGGQLFGKVTKILTRPGEDPDPVCSKCEPDDDRYNKKVIGMEIIRGMKADGGQYSDGDILDPKIGKVYKCKLWLDGKDLKVRGYWGPFYRTQVWKRLK